MKLVTHILSIAVGLIALSMNFFLPQLYAQDTPKQLEKKDSKSSNKKRGHRQRRDKKDRCKSKMQTNTNI